MKRLDLVAISATILHVYMQAATKQVDLDQGAGMRRHQSSWQLLKATTKHGFGLAIPKDHDALFEADLELIYEFSSTRKVRYAFLELRFFLSWFCLVHSLATSQPFNLVS